MSLADERRRLADTEAALDIAATTRDVYARQIAARDAEIADLQRQLSMERYARQALDSHTHPAGSEPPTNPTQLPGPVHLMTGAETLCGLTAREVSSCVTLLSKEVTCYACRGMSAPRSEGT